MKKLLLFVSFVLLLAGCATQTVKEAKPVTLVKGGKSSYSIVLPDRIECKPVENHLTAAARALQSAVKEGFGAELPIVKESKLAPGAKAIFIGDTQTVRKAGFEPAKFEESNFIVAERNGNVFIAGHDAPGWKARRNHSPYIFHFLGSVKGIVHFMEKIVGTRIMYPGETGRTTPKQDVLAVPAGLTQFVKPRLIMGTSRHHELMYDFAANDFGYPGFHLYGGHSYYSAVPEKVYGKTHPEYFIYKGRGRSTSGNHLCISNPQVQELIYQEAKKRLAGGAEIVELAQTDGFQPCDCAKCKALYGVPDFGEKLWILHRSIAERLYKEMPDKKVLIISYWPTNQPPRTFKAFPPNTMVELCCYNDENLAAWRKIEVPQGFTSYVYYWGCYKQPGYTPMHGPAYLAGQVQKFAAMNIKGVYRSGFGDLFGMEGPCYYVYAKMWDDPSQDYRLILQDFYKHAFGEASLPMERFYSLLFERLKPYDRLDPNAEAKGVLLKTDGKEKGKFDHESGGYYVMPKNPRAYLGFVYTPDLLNSMENFLARAEKTAVNRKVKARLALVRIEFDYLKNLGTIVHLYNAYRLKPDKFTFDSLAEEIVKRNRMIDSYFDAKGKKKSIPGWREMKIFDTASTKSMLLTNGRLAAPLGAPFTWNIARLQKSGILPGTLKQRAVVFRRRPGALEDFTKGAWKNIPAHKLQGIQLGPVKYQTAFKLMYDDKNLYAAFEADLPADRTYTAQGRDGGATARDCLEFFIDPQGEKESYYHLLWNPVPDSFYDSARGFIKDPLDPLYNRFDVSWNGKWEYKNIRRGNKWYSLLVLPHKTIKAAVPRSGTVWCMNVGRTQYPAARFENNEESLWSPNLETMSFHETECFGDIIFE